MKRILSFIICAVMIFSAQIYRVEASTTTIYPNINVDNEVKTIKNLYSYTNDKINNGGAKKYYHDNYVAYANDLNISKITYNDFDNGYTAEFYYQQGYENNNELRFVYFTNDKLTCKFYYKNGYLIRFIGNDETFDYLIGDEIPSYIKDFSDIVWKLGTFLVYSYYLNY